MTITLGGASAQINGMLGAGIGSLDITEAERAKVVNHYQQVGRTLDHHWASSPGENRVYAQGSFLLGTVTRRYHHNDDIDIDIVILRDVNKSSTTQVELKQDSGRGLQKYIAANPREMELIESDRCWTLQSRGMHLDALPAIPADGTATSDDGPIQITDHAHTRWLQSDPLGYGRWFYGVTRREMLLKESVLAKRMDIDDVPEWERKSVLQLTVQALKRHRDIFFADRLHLRPSSIVITTLAALAYEATDDLYDALRTITAKMPQHLRFVDGEYTLLNPVLPEESFTDGWAADPDRARNFLDWMEAAMADFNAIGERSGQHRVLEGLADAFGQKASMQAALSGTRPLATARREGRLFAQGGSATLTTEASADARPVPDHTFRGGRRRCD